MESVEAEGTSIDGAIDNALRLLGITRDRVEIEILVNASRGLFGIGGRKAKVRATLRSPLDADLRMEMAEVRESPRRVTSAPRPARQADHRVAERAQQVLQDIVQYVGVAAEVRVDQDDGHVVLDLTGDSSGVLIGRRGQMLDALEHLVNRIVSRDEGAAARIIVDSNNYRVRHRQALEDLARRTGSEAKKRRRSLTLNPMSPRDRRIVHLVLQEDPSLSTRSSGKGYYRRVIIVPTGAGRAPRSDS